MVRYFVKISFFFFYDWCGPQATLFSFFPKFVSVLGFSLYCVTYSQFDLLLTLPVGLLILRPRPLNSLVLISNTSHKPLLAVQSTTYRLISSHVPRSDTKEHTPRKCTRLRFKCCYPLIIVTSQLWLVGGIESIYLTANRTLQTTRQLELNIWRDRYLLCMVRLLHASSLPRRQDAYAPTRCSIVEQVRQSLTCRPVLPNWE